MTTKPLGTCDTAHKITKLPSKEEPWVQRPHEQSPFCTRWRPLPSGAETQTNGPTENSLTGSSRKGFDSPISEGIAGGANPQSAHQPAPAPQAMTAREFARTDNWYRATNQHEVVKEFWFGFAEAYAAALREADRREIVVDEIMLEVLEERDDLRRQLAELHEGKGE